MQGLFTRPPKFLSEMSAIGSILAGYDFLWATFSRFLTPLRDLLRRVRAMLFREVCVTVAHQSGYGHSTNELYFAVESYLRAAIETADKLKVAVGRDGAVALSLDNGEQVADAFHGVPLLWNHCSEQLDDHKSCDRRGRGGGGEKRWYTLSFLRRYRSVDLESYLNGILAQYREMEGKARKRRRYSNYSRTWPRP